MKKRKNTAIFILTAAMILICAMLPMIVGQIQDSLESSNIAYEEIKSVQFSKELSDLEKIVLFCNGESVEVSENKTKIKEMRFKMWRKQHWRLIMMQEC